MSDDLLIEALARQTRIMSSGWHMRRTQAYGQIARMGRSAVPRLLAALERDDAPAVPIMMLLADITGAHPAEDTGDVQGAAGAWIEWGRARA